MSTSALITSNLTMKTVKAAIIANPGVESVPEKRLRGARGSTASTLDSITSSLTVKTANPGVEPVLKKGLMTTARGPAKKQSPQIRYSERPNKTTKLVVRLSQLTLTQGVATPASVKEEGLNVVA